MLQTFWGKFGWGHVPVVGDRTYLILAVVAALGVVGAPFALWRKRGFIPWETPLLLGIAVCGIWFAAMVRGTVESLFGRAFIPGSRYAYPAIVPTLALLNIGWLEILRKVAGRLNVSKRTRSLVYSLLFVVLDVIALVSILRYYSNH